MAPKAAPTPPAGAATAGRPGGFEQPVATELKRVVQVVRENADRTPANDAARAFSMIASYNLMFTDNAEIIKGSRQHNGGANGRMLDSLLTTQVMELTENFPPQDYIRYFWKHHKLVLADARKETSDEKAFMFLHTTWMAFQEVMGLKDIVALPSMTPEQRDGITLRQFMRVKDKVGNFKAEDVVAVLASATEAGIMGTAPTPSPTPAADASVTFHQARPAARAGVSSRWRGRPGSCSVPGSSWRGPSGCSRRPWTRSSGSASSSPAWSASSARW